ncbi:unnamed protein product [Brassicogethes aeneus]|uniref:Uncharacterized protein n=1 Tax=Brassicogethes aeneus TaxID=1431903 RepID=A0A9P0B2V8_BRAAE|nr:unnamed protein product [Brassicogethes aeneus]
MYPFCIILFLQIYTGYARFCEEDAFLIPYHWKDQRCFSTEPDCIPLKGSWFGESRGETLYCYSFNMEAENISSSFIESVSNYHPEADHSIFAYNDVSLFPTQLYISNILPGSFEKVNNSLTELYFDLNNIQIIRKGVFNCLGRLRILSFKFNKLEIIEEDAFSGLEKLTHLDLKHNFIYHLNQNTFYPLKNLYLLDISNNFINTANQSHLRFTSITEFYLDYNKIHQLQNVMFNNVSVNILDISHNNLSVIEPEAFLNQNNLYDLNLNNNKLDKLSSSLHYLLGLKKLDLSYNNLQTISMGFFDHFNYLESLNLTHNKLVSVLGSNVLNVKYLGLAYNKIKEFDIKSLKSFPKLNQISLDGNMWDCKILSSVAQELSSRSIVIKKGHERNLINVLGIECSESNDTTKTTIDVKNSSFFKYLEEGYKKSNFYKYLDSLNNTSIDDKNTSIFKYFEEDYKKSNFFKYLDSFNKDTLLDQNTPIVIILITTIVILVDFLKNCIK